MCNESFPHYRLGFKLQPVIYKIFCVLKNDGPCKINIYPFTPALIDSAFSCTRDRIDWQAYEYSLSVEMGYNEVER